MTDRMRRSQTLPEDFRATLAQLRADRDPRLPMVLYVGKCNGWTYQVMADASGVSKEWVRQLILNVDMTVGGHIPDVPLPARKPVAPRKLRPARLLVKPEVANQLRAMAKVASTVRGTTPIDAPERRVGEELAATLNALIQQGVSIKHLAETLGVRRSAIQSRLGRHGYRDLPPSLAHTRYLGRPKGGTR